MNKLFRLSRKFGNSLRIYSAVTTPIGTAKLFVACQGSSDPIFTSGRIVIILLDKVDADKIIQEKSTQGTSSFHSSIEVIQINE